MSHLETTDLHIPTRLRGVRTQWKHLPDYHGYSNQKLTRLHGVLPTVSPPYLRNGVWRVQLHFNHLKNSKSMPFVSALSIYHGYLTTELNKYAIERNEEKINRSKWNEFVDYASSIGHTYQDTLPPIKTIVKMDETDEICIVLLIKADEEYYPGEEMYHNAIEVGFLDCDIQESNDLKFLNDIQSKMVSLSEIEILRKAKQGDNDRYLQSIAFGLNEKKLKEREANKVEELEEKISDASDKAMSNVANKINSSLREDQRTFDKVESVAISNVVMEDVFSVIDESDAKIEVSNVFKDKHRKTVKTISGEASEFNKIWPDMWSRRIKVNGRWHTYEASNIFMNYWEKREKLVAHWKVVKK